MSRIKICGLSRIQDIYAANDAMPDYIGFVFAKSKRMVSKNQAKLFKESLDRRIKAVGVFVNEEINFIKSIYEDGIIDIVQLHGDEGKDYLFKLKNQVSCPVIKAIRVKDGNDVSDAQNLYCDYLLFDTYTDQSYGGSGKTFDWSLVREVKKPFFLAGGIGEHNAGDALKTAKPYCIDVSSYVETNGLKDAAKIKKIVKLIRSVS